MHPFANKTSSFIFFPYFFEGFVGSQLSSMHAIALYLNDKQRQVPTTAFVFALFNLVKSAIKSLMAIPGDQLVTTRIAISILEQTEPVLSICI